MSGVFPLPWYGVTVSASYQALAGNLLGTDALPYGVFTAGTGFNQPNGQSTYLAGRAHDTPTPRQPASRARAPWGRWSFRGSTNATLNVPITAPSTEYTPRINQVDFSASKSFQVARFRIQPKLDMFNALNSDDYTGVSTMQFQAAAYQRPSVILQGRVIRIGADVKW